MECLTGGLSEAEARLVHLALGNLLPILNDDDRKMAKALQGRLVVSILEESAAADDMAAGR